MTKIISSQEKIEIEEKNAREESSAQERGPHLGDADGIARTLFFLFRDPLTYIRQWATKAAAAAAATAVFLSHGAPHAVGEMTAKIRAYACVHALARRHRVGHGIRLGGRVTKVTECGNRVVAVGDDEDDATM